MGKINALLGWDLNVNLPPKAGKGRAGQTAYITKLISNKWLESNFQKLVQDTGKQVGSLGNEEKAIIRNLKRLGKYYWKVPQKTVIELSEVTSNAFMVWQKAREENKFKSFLPHLKKLIVLNREIAEHLGYKDNPYDALLDIYEQDLTAGEFQKIVDVLQPNLTNLVKQIKRSSTFKDQVFKGRSEYTQIDQERLSVFVLKKMGYDMEAGRQDVSAHPFTETLGSRDVRITNRYKQNNFVESVMVAMHEGGHALYEQGINLAYDATPLEMGVSLGIHESQSRFWENQVGRSRAFVRFLTPTLKKCYPKQLKNVSPDKIYQHFNAVRPGLIRVEADEVTYNLHIALRFEIENGLINDRIKPENLPEIWNAKMKEYLGVVPDKNANGVLQDVHWSYGSFGYFPTYTLGNLYAAQITKVLNKAMNLDSLLSAGDLKPVLTWLTQNIYRHGSLYTPGELIKRVTGEKLNPNYFLEYVTTKYFELYKLSEK